MTKTKKIKPVMIEWADACASSGWSYETVGNETAPVARCFTIGWPVHEDKEQVIIAATMSDGAHNQRMAIPKAWIKKRTVIRS
jgi:hypothetical protein